MTKLHFKLKFLMKMTVALLLRALAVSIAVLVIVPSFATAQDLQQGTTPLRTNFCVSTNEIGARLVARINEHQAVYDIKRADGKTKIMARLNERMARLQAGRQTADASRDEIEAGLLAKAGSEERAVAIKKYTSSVKDAVSRRRLVIDAVSLSYRTALEAELTTRQNSVKLVVDTFLVDSNNALLVASAACSLGGARPLDVRLNYTKEMGIARTKMVEGIKAIESRGSALQPVVVAGQEQIAKAVLDFATTADAARQELRNALGAQAL